MVVEVEHVAEGSRFLFFSFPLVVPLIVATISLAVAHFWLEQRRMAKLGNLIPGPPTLPLLGNAHYVYKKTHHGKYCIPGFLLCHSLYIRGR